MAEVESRPSRRAFTLEELQAFFDHADEVTQTPERLSLAILAALCDIFQCAPTDLVHVSAETTAQRKASGQDRNVVDLASTGRPKRARLKPQR